MSIPKRLRFEIFRRDKYACVYCGRRAPSITLEVDHRIPRCKGGTDDPSNLVSACWDCNRGKGPLDVEEEIEYDEDLFDKYCRLAEIYFYSPDEDILEDDYPFNGQGYPRPRKPLTFDFDIYAAAAELPPAEQVLVMTSEAVMRKAELFR